jgi:hypothetical protein
MPTRVRRDQTSACIYLTRFQNIAKHYARLLSRWPKDPVRPENTFHKLLSARTAKAHTLSDSEANAELRNVNALYSLLDDRYKKKVCGRPTSSVAFG